jgi:DNA-binding MarR family transcriptional regulator
MYRHYIDTKPFVTNFVVEPATVCGEDENGKAGLHAAESLASIRTLAIPTQMKIEEEIKQAQFRSPLHRLIVNLMYTNNWLSDSQMRLLKPFGLTVPQYNVLRILRGQHPQPVKINDITERMMDKMSNASRLVDKLVSKKLVYRTECPSDRRAVDVLIAEKGLALLKKIDVAQDSWEAQFKVYEGVKADELNALLNEFRSVATDN